MRLQPVSRAQLGAVLLLLGAFARALWRLGTQRFVAQVMRSLGLAASGTADAAQAHETKSSPRVRFAARRLESVSLSLRPNTEP